MIAVCQAQLGSAMRAASAVLGAASEMSFSEQVEQQIRDHNKEVQAARLVQAAWRRMKARNAFRNSTTQPGGFAPTPSVRRKTRQRPVAERWEDHTDPDG